jgi:hypothetical protein
MSDLADSARTTYAAALGYSEGLGYGFYAGAAIVQRAAVTLNASDLSLRLQSGVLTWRSAIVAEGEIDTLVANRARNELLCARELATQQGNTLVSLKVDTLLLTIDSFLEDHRRR